MPRSKPKSPVLARGTQAAVFSLALGIGTTAVLCAVLMAVGLAVFVVIEFGLWVLLAAIPAFSFTAWLLQAVTGRRERHVDSARLSQEVDKRRYAALVGMRFPVRPAPPGQQGGESQEPRS